MKREMCREYNERSHSVQSALKMPLRYCRDRFSREDDRTCVSEKVLASDSEKVHTLKRSNFGLGKSSKLTLGIFLKAHTWDVFSKLTLGFFLSHVGFFSKLTLGIFLKL